MKSIFASLILALIVASVAGKDRPCIFRVHVMKKCWRLIGEKKKT